MGKYYIAYGSNLNKKQMLYRCPTANAVGNGYVKDYELIFRVYATNEKAIGKRVPIALWEIDDECEARLDRYEGYPRLYRKEIIKVVIDGKTYDAMVYIMNEETRDYQTPSIEYYNVVLHGYRDMGLQCKYLDEGIDRTEQVIKTKTKEADKK